MLFSGLFHSHTLLTDKPPEGDTRDPTTQPAPNQVAKRHLTWERQTTMEDRRIAGRSRTTKSRNPPSLRQNRHGTQFSAWKRQINGFITPRPPHDAKTRRTITKGKPRKEENSKRSDPGLDTAPAKHKQGKLPPDLKLNSVETNLKCWFFSSHAVYSYVGASRRISEISVGSSATWPADSPPHYGWCFWFMPKS